MVFMLKMLGIEATNVHCHDNRSHREGTNHSIVRLFLNGKYVYIDLSLVESMENNAGLRSISRKGETDRIFYCVDFAFRSRIADKFCSLFSNRKLWLWKLCFN